MQLIFYVLNEKFESVELSRTSIKASSIYIPVPRLYETITFDFTPTKNAQSYTVYRVEYVFVPSTNATVELYYIQVYLRETSNKEVNT